MYTTEYASSKFFIHPNSSVKKKRCGNSAKERNQSLLNIYTVQGDGAGHHRGADLHHAHNHITRLIQDQDRRLKDSLTWVLLMRMRLDVPSLRATKKLRNQDQHIGLESWWRWKKKMDRGVTCFVCVSNAMSGGVTLAIKSYILRSLIRQKRASEMWIVFSIYISYLLFLANSSTRIEDRGITCGYCWRLELLFDHELDATDGAGHKKHRKKDEHEKHKHKKEKKAKKDKKEKKDKDKKDERERREKDFG